MMITTVNIDTRLARERLERLGMDLDDNQLSRAMSRGINRTLLKARTALRKEIKEEYNIPQRYMDRIYIRKASQNHLEGDLNASRKAVPLDAFSPVEVKGTTKTVISRRGNINVRQMKRITVGQGVRVEVHKGDPEMIPYSFLLKNGKARVFARGAYGEKGFEQRHHRVSNEGNDTPIKPLITTSVFATGINAQVQQRMAAIVNSEFETEMARAARSVLLGR